MKLEVFDPITYAMSTTPPERLADIAFAKSTLESIRAAAEAKANDQRRLRRARARKSLKMNRK